MDKSDQLRPFYLARILYDRTDEDHYLTNSQLMTILQDEFGIKTHRQTIPSDVALLRTLGMDIQEVLSSEKRYNVVSRAFDLAEIKLLIDAVHSAKFITKKKSADLVTKLTGLASRNQADTLKRNIAVEDRVKRDNENILLIIDAVNDAINLGKKISFLYFKYDVRKRQQIRNDGEPFIFSPHHLIWNGDYYYMVGVFDNGKRFGAFRLDRIVARPEILPEKALPYPKDFKLNKYLQTSFRMYGKTYTKIELICKNEVMDAIVDKFGKGVTVKPVDKEHFKIDVDASVNNVFFSWVFGFNGKVKINSPNEVRDQYKQMVMSAAEDLID